MAVTTGEDVPSTEGSSIRMASSASSNRRSALASTAMRDHALNLSPDASNEAGERLSAHPGGTPGASMVRPPWYASERRRAPKSRTAYVGICAGQPSKQDETSLGQIAEEWFCRNLQIERRRQRLADLGLVKESRGGVDEDTAARRLEEAASSGRVEI